MSLFYSKNILENLKVFKIFAKVNHPDVKFHGKHDRDIAEPVRPTVLELRPKSVQKWGPDPLKMVPTEF